MGERLTDDELGARAERLAERLRRTGARRPSEIARWLEDGGLTPTDARAVLDHGLASGLFARIPGTPSIRAAACR